MARDGKKSSRHIESNITEQTYPIAEITITFNDRASRQRLTAHRKRDGTAVAAPIDHYAIGSGEGRTGKGRRVVCGRHCSAFVVFVGVAGGAGGLDGDVDVHG